MYHSFINLCANHLNKNKEFIKKLFLFVTSYQKDENSYKKIIILKKKNILEISKLKRCELDNDKFSIEIPKDKKNTFILKYGELINVNFRLHTCKSDIKKKLDLKFDVTNKDKKLYTSYDV
jgi:hypothetical protein